MIEIYKEKYLTCLQALEKFRLENPEFKDEVMGYAGILDPMAEGLVPVLVGKEENQDRVRFTQADKEYEVKILLGISTDTYDLLGLINQKLEYKVSLNMLNEVIRAFAEHPREFEQTISMFANWKYKGKRLWEWGRAGIEIPESERKKTKVTIHELDVEGVDVILREQLENEIKLMEEKIGPGFRLEKVVEEWEKYLDEIKWHQWYQIELRIMVSKGFYVRKLVEDLGKELGVPMLVYWLKRTKILYKKKEQ